MTPQLLDELGKIGFTIRLDDIGLQRGYVVTTDVGQWEGFATQEEALIEGVKKLLHLAGEADADPDVSL